MLSYHVVYRKIILCLYIIVLTSRRYFVIIRELKYSMNNREMHFSIYHVVRPRLSRETLAFLVLFPS